MSLRSLELGAEDLGKLHGNASLTTTLASTVLSIFTCLILSPQETCLPNVSLSLDSLTIPFVFLRKK